MGVKMLGKILGGLMVLGITTVPAPLVAASKLEITDPRAAKIKEIVTLPIKGIRAVESDGQIVFISDNGRFVITGQIYDVWGRMDVDKLNTISFGHGPKDVVLFVDPRCGVCHKLIGEAKPLAEEYTFKIVVIPALGDESNQLAKALHCAKDKTNALDALLNNTLGSDRYSGGAIRHCTRWPCKQGTP